MSILYNLLKATLVYTLFRIRNACDFRRRRSGHAHCSPAVYVLYRSDPTGPPQVVSLCAPLRYVRLVRYVYTSTHYTDKEYTMHIKLSFYDSCRGLTNCVAPADAPRRRHSRSMIVVKPRPMRSTWPSQAFLILNRVYIYIYDWEPYPYPGPYCI